MSRYGRIILCTLVLLLGIGADLTPSGRAASPSVINSRVYLPGVSYRVSGAGHGTLPRVNVPHFSADVPFGEMAVFWLGRVTAEVNYADVRVAYTDTELRFHVAVFDRLLWYDNSPSASDMAAWDAVSLYLNTAEDGGATPSTAAYRFDAMLSWWEGRENYQAAYRGNGTSWSPATTPFRTSASWRGDAPNNTAEDRGWTASFAIPFAGLGVSSPPPEGTIWRLGLTVHDRDGAAESAIPRQNWPQTQDPNRPDTWGTLHFGLPPFLPPSVATVATTTVRHKQDGVIVPDADVGGVAANQCPGDSTLIWNAWGEANWGHESSVNVQNQSDVADWPCFAKYFVSFPLDTLPGGKVVTAATLTMHQFGNADPGGARPSWIQVLTASESWEEESITWNNAPLAGENLGGSWVEPLAAPPPWPGVPRTWDVSRAVAQAYAQGQPVRLILYSADDAYHSGKFFVSSDTGDWNAAGRPTLSITWGEP